MKDEESKSVMAFYQTGSYTRKRKNCRERKNCRYMIRFANSPFNPCRFLPRAYTCSSVLWYLHTNTYTRRIPTSLSYHYIYACTVSCAFSLTSLKSSVRVVSCAVCCCTRPLSDSRRMRANSASTRAASLASLNCRCV